MQVLGLFCDVVCVTGCVAACVADTVSPIADVIGAGTAFNTAKSA